MILLRVVLLASVLTFTMSAFATPRQILIIRHAEKPTVGDEGIHLSERGRERANALPMFFSSHPEMSAGEVPAAIYAASPKRPEGSVRAYETIVPTASQFGLEVNRNFRSGEESAIAYEILSRPEYHGKTVILCWVRDELPLLANALGVSAELRWPPPVFDRVWKITYENGVAQLKTVQQQLLAGDQ